MKNKFLLATVCIAVLGIAFVACNDDDDNDNGSYFSNKIVGTWTLDIEYTPESSFYTDYTDRYDVMNLYKIYSHIQFLKDGTCIKVTQVNPYIRDVQPNNNREVIFGKYKISNKTLTFIDDNVESDAELDIVGSKMYIAYVQDDKRVEFIYTRVDDSEMDEYYMKENMDYLETYKVDIEKYRLDDNYFDRYKVDMSKYEVDLANNKVNLKTNIPKFSCPDNRHPHAIDMGAAGKWACCNVGADNPALSGGYYAWGETEEKPSYEKSNYIHYKTVADAVAGNVNIGKDIAGSRYDVAYMKWGGDWIMPSISRIDALLKNCTTKWTEFKMYDTDNTDNCYRINGNIYRLDNIDDELYYFVIGDKLYRLDEFFHFNSSYYINGEVVEHGISNRYLINGHYYEISTGMAQRLYIIDNKAYEISDIDNIYVKGNELYFVPDATTVKGISGLPATLLYKSKYSLENKRIDKCFVRLVNLKINNVSGVILTSKDTKKSIFLPNTGGMWSNQIEVAGYGLFAKYWISSYYDKDAAYTLGLHNPDVALLNGMVSEGYPVRPVKR